jgi:2-dehydropantoate 2-reductase
MRFAVIGVGGVGGYFGGRLAQSGAEVVFVARGATLEALRTRGLRVDSIAGDFVVPHVDATDDPASAGAVDAVLLTVKTNAIAEVLPRIAPMLKPETPVIPLENGLDAPMQIESFLGREHAMGGLCGIVSFIAEPGHIRHVAAEPFVMLGELDNAESPRALAVRDALRAAGVKADIPPDIHRSLWTKFLFIAPMSGAGALTRVPVGVWRAMRETRAIAEAMVREIIAVATARGIALDANAFDATMARYDAMQPESTTSLQRDIMQGKPSELDAQLGAVVRMGRESGVPVPVSELVYHALLPQERAAHA